MNYSTRALVLFLAAILMSGAGLQIIEAQQKGKGKGKGGKGKGGKGAKAAKGNEETIGKGAASPKPVETAQSS